MQSYQIEFAGRGKLRPSLNVVCDDDHQALRWASGLLSENLGAEVSSEGRLVGWATTADSDAQKGL